MLSIKSIIQVHNTFQDQSIPHQNTMSSPPRVFEGKLAIITGASRSTSILSMKDINTKLTPHRLWSRPRNTLRLPRRQRSHQLRNHRLHPAGRRPRHQALLHLQHQRPPRSRRPTGPLRARPACRNRKSAFQQVRPLPDRYSGQQRRHRQRPAHPRARHRPVPADLRPQRARPGAPHQGCVSLSAH